MSKKIYCIAEFAPKHGCEQELFEALMGLEPLSSREDGCIKYKVTRQIKHPQALSESKFSIVFHEEWASVEDFDLHCSKPYMVEFFNKYVENADTSIIDDCSIRVFSDEI